jgi:hypothetical protein
MRPWSLEGQDGRARISGLAEPYYPTKVRKTYSLDNPMVEGTHPI